MVWVVIEEVRRHFLGGLLRSVDFSFFFFFLFLTLFFLRASKKKPGRCTHNHYLRVGVFFPFFVVVWVVCWKEEVAEWEKGKGRGVCCCVLYVSFVGGAARRHVTLHVFSHSCLPSSFFFLFFFPPKSSAYLHYEQRWQRVQACKKKCRYCYP